MAHDSSEHDHEHKPMGTDFFYLPVSQIPKVEIIRENRAIFQKCLPVLKHFFTRQQAMRSTLKGFLFEGVPGTGKTELARQLAREAGQWGESKLDDTFLLFLDAASIASPGWGNAEATLRIIFDSNERLRVEKMVPKPKVILLFDDIESLMLARGSDIVKEWHFSINAILFHELDRADPSRIFVLATSNRPDLIDDALRDRLYSIKFRLPSKESLLQIARDQLRQMGGLPEDRERKVMKVIEAKVAARRRSMTIRELERLVIMEYVDKGLAE